jgi:hypothetical protein
LTVWLIAVVGVSVVRGNLRWQGRKTLVHGTVAPVFTDIARFAGYIGWRGHSCVVRGGGVLIVGGLLWDGFVDSDGRENRLLRGGNVSWWRDTL